MSLVIRYFYVLFLFSLQGTPQRPHTRPTDHTRRADPIPHPDHTRHADPTPRPDHTRRTEDTLLLDPVSING